MWPTLPFFLDCMSNSQVYFIVQMSNPRDGTRRRVLRTAAGCGKSSVSLPATVIEDRDVNSRRLHQQVSQEPPRRLNSLFTSRCALHHLLLRWGKSHSEKQMSLAGCHPTHSHISSATRVCARFYLLCYANYGQKWTTSLSREQLCEQPWVQMLSLKSRRMRFHANKLVSINLSRIIP